MQRPSSDISKVAHCRRGHGSKRRLLSSLLNVLIVPKTLLTRLNRSRPIRADKTKHQLCVTIISVAHLGFLLSISIAYPASEVLNSVLFWENHATEISTIHFDRHIARDVLRTKTDGRMDRGASQICMRTHKMNDDGTKIMYKKAVLPQGNRAMPQVFFSVEVRQQHSLQV